MRLRLPKTRGMLRREAAGWMARLQSGREPDIEAKFRHWYEAHPAHAAAFDRVERSFGQAGLLRNLDLASFNAPSAAPAASARIQRYAMAAAAAVVLVPAAVLTVGGGGLSLGGPTVLMLATRVGEIREVKLGDGSKVTLDTASAVEIDVGRSHRRATLRKGRARFAVVGGGTPFVIEAGDAAVTTNGGTVDVAEQGQIDVLHGGADVRRPDGHRVSLTAGQTIDRTNGQMPSNPGAAPDWTQGMLQFDGTPLLSAVTVANRYSDHRILLGGGLDNLRVTGAFKAGDTAGLAKALAAAFHLSLGVNARGDLILSRGAATD